MTCFPTVHPWALAWAPSRTHSDSAPSSLFPFHFSAHVHDCARVHAHSFGASRPLVVPHPGQSPSLSLSLSLNRRKTRRWIRRRLLAYGRYNTLLESVLVYGRMLV